MSSLDFISLFDGRTLDGWVAQPRVYGAMWPGGANVYEVSDALPPGTEEAARRHPAAWTVEDGAIVGRQSPPASGFGGYLVTESTFGDFELVLEARPDWPADTGIMIRRRFDEWAGLQVLYDHRPNGSIGGFYGNGIGGFLAAPFTTDLVEAQGARRRTVSNQPPWSTSSARMLTFAADPGDFLRVWREGDWNELRVRCVGEIPTVTTWVNDVHIATVDLAALRAENYDVHAVSALLGDRGHIALEVHDNDAALGFDRWGPEAACRWRNIRIANL